MKDNTDEPLVLTDENGDEVCFELLDLVDWDDRVFAILMPYEENGDMLHIYEYVENEEDVSFIGVDEATVSEVFEVYKKKSGISDNA